MAYKILVPSKRTSICPRCGKNAKAGPGSVAVWDPNSGKGASYHWACRPTLADPPKTSDAVGYDFVGEISEDVPHLLWDSKAGWKQTCYGCGTSIAPRTGLSAVFSRSRERIYVPLCSHECVEAVGFSFLLEGAKEQVQKQQARDEVKAELLSEAENWEGILRNIAPGLRLRRPQEEAVRFLLSRKRALLADDKGVGKTIEALAAIPPGSSVLVACPSSVVLSWKREVEKWRPDLKPRTFDGPGERVEGPPPAGEVWITVNHYSRLPRPTFTALDSSMAWPQADERFQNTIFILDEAHHNKGVKKTAQSDGLKHYPKRAEASLAITQAARRTWFLTATPIPNKPIDLWGILLNGRMHKETFGSFNTFRELFGGRSGRYGLRWYEEEADYEEVAKCLSRVMLQRSLSEIRADMPSFVRNRIYVKVGNKLSAMFADLFGDVKQAPPQKQVEAFEKLSKPSFSQISTMRSLAALSRVGAAVDWVKDIYCQGDKNVTPDRPLLVFSDHKKPVHQIADKLNKSGYGGGAWLVIDGDTSREKRQQIVDQFQAGELAGLCATIPAMAEGVTLTAADTILFVDRSWTPAKNDQAEGRIRRLNQDAETLHIYDIVGDHPVDDILLSGLTAKEDVIRQVLGGGTPFDEEDETARLALETERLERSEAPAIPGANIVTEMSLEERQQAALDRWDAEQAELSNERVRERIESRGGIKAYAEEQLDRESRSPRARSGGVLPEPAYVRWIRDSEVTDAEHEVLLEALNRLRSVCDGALKDDGVGFNKPDQGVARAFDLYPDTPETRRALRAVVQKYRGQLFEQLGFTQAWVLMAPTRGTEDAITTAVEESLARTVDRNPERFPPGFLGGEEARAIVHERVVRMMSYLEAKSVK
jgi:superfamily II DNA or RNA helicase